MTHATAVRYLDRPLGAGAMGWLALRTMRLVRWRVVSVEPMPHRCVVVFYPHTSNWDLVLGLMAKWIMRLDFHVVVKDSAFVGPFGGLLTRLGGIAINRREPTGVVAALAARFRESEVLRLVIAPEGTRRRADHWKSGFYTVATAAQVPFALSFVDYARRETGIGAWFMPSGDREADLRAIAAFYADKTAKFPAQAGPVRFASAAARTGGVRPGSVPTACANAGHLQINRDASSSVGNLPCGVNLSTASGSSRVSRASSSSRDRPVSCESVFNTSGPIARSSCSGANG